MIKKITFENYKAFKENQMLELRPITLLLGKNSSGKSSLCKLIEMLSTTLNPSSSSSNAVDPFISGGGNLFHAGDLTELKVEILDDKEDFVKFSYYNSHGVNHLKSLSFSVDKELLTPLVLQRFGNDMEKPCIRQRLTTNNVAEDKFSFSCQHIGPLRKGGHLFNSGTDRQSVLGEDGYGAYTRLVDSLINGTDLLPKTSVWLGDNLDGQNIIVEPIPMQNVVYYDFQIGVNGIPVENVGEGLRQVLPIIVESFNSDPAALTIIEQPVLHLHSAAHAAVANRLAMSAIDNGRSYIIETHSENFFLELRRMVSDRTCLLKAEDVIAYYVDMTDGASTLIPIELDENGEVSFWPGDIWEESSMLLSKIANNKQ